MTPKSKAVETYLEELRSALADLPQPGVEEMIRELRVHIADRTSQNPDAAIDLTWLGDVSEITSEYRAQASVTRIAAGRYPWEMLGGAFQWARASFLGAIIFSLALTGYLTAIVCLLCGAFKALHPNAIGLWTTGRRLLLGLLQTQDSAFQVVGVTAGLWPPTFVVGTVGRLEAKPAELMGWWLIPAALAAGIVTALFVTRLVRRLAREALRSRGTALRA